MNTAGIHVNSTLSITSLTLAGAASGVTTLAAGNTTITGFANVSSSVNAASFTVGTTFAANATSLFLGNSTSNSTITQTQFNMLSSVGFAPQILARNSANDAFGGYWNAGKSRLGGIVLSGDDLGTFMFQGHDGNTFVNSAYLFAEVDGSPVANSGYVPSRLSFLVSNTTATSARLTINSTSTNVTGLLAAGNTTITGFANVTSTIQGGSSLTVAGALSGVTTAAMGNTTITGDITVSGNLTINGTTTNINSTNLVVEDKNIILGDVTTPSDVTADSGGITLKGATDKTFNWVNATNAWTSSEDLNLLTGKVYEINGTTVLSGSALGTGITGSSLTSVGTLSSLTLGGAVSGITTLAAGNTSITGFANVSTSVNSALLTVGTSFIANTTGVYHTGTVNAASHTVGSSFIANSTGVTSTGFANVSTTLTVGGNSSITGNLVVSGITTLTGNVSAGANVSAKALILDNAAIFSNTVTVSNTSQNIIDSFPKASYSFGKLILTVKPSSGTERHASEILLLHDNTDVLITEYAQLFNTSLGSFDAGINNANVEIYFTSTSANGSVTQTVKVIRQSS